MTAGEGGLRVQLGFKTMRALICDPPVNDLMVEQI